jgi:hypothetical protein
VIQGKSRFLVGKMSQKAPPKVKFYYYFKIMLDIIEENAIFLAVDCKKNKQLIE